ncbi:TonB-dependent receptor [Chitinophaga sp.]|uniref:SusC/RagA family TonB-linked outer membrane protein n=1 Tax=Chitinophaga sp. TaxID=1869181 RepID=UPI002C698D1D|nr:TonB-dependent receptor [Chitinophaga sp.]HWV64703.1 TonB-dependent receptor [Chitinophaga sp.]
MRNDHLRGKLCTTATLLLCLLLCTRPGYSQQVSNTVKGVVQSTSNERLPGVSIVVRNTKTNFTSGTITDTAGLFTFRRLPAGGPYSFTFSIIGYEPQTLSGYTIREDATVTLAVKLEANTRNIDQVVVVGYGTQKRKDLTGSVGTLSNVDIAEQNTIRPEQALAGKLPGVQVKPSSGEPGAAPQIRIRGVGSISASAEPLYVVDGFPVSSIQTLNPSDIESMDVLKDASATAIYGSRGSNGVVIINTKRGKAGKPVFNFSASYGVQKAAKIPKFQSAFAQAQDYYDGIRNRNIDEGNPVDGDPLHWVQAVPITILEVLAGKPLTQPGTTNNFKDHIYEVLQDAPTQQYQLGASGGSENVKYAISGEFLDQDGIVVNTNFKRFSARANIDAKLSKKLTLKVNMNPSYMLKKNIGGRMADEVAADGGRGSDIIYNALQIPEYYSLLNPDGSYFPFGDGLDAVVSTQNPLALAREVQRKQQAVGFLGNIAADYEVIKDLHLNVMAGTNMTDIQGMYFKPKLPAFNNNPATGTSNSSQLINWLTEITANYTKAIGKHNLAALLGYTTQKESLHSNFLTSNRYPNNLIPTLSAVSGIITNGSADIDDWSLVSYLGRINYNYANKYYLTTSVRSDGSSRFGSNNKYGIFPSIALAWRLTEESFMKPLKFVSDMKLRLSYGQTGNNNIGNYEQYATVEYVKYILANNAAGGYAPGKLANPDLTWEKQKSFNAGLDIKLFRYRVGIAIDHYQSTNYDLLLEVNVPGITGFTTALQNIGEVKNKGWEFAVNTVNIDGPFKWTTDLNLSTNQGEVRKLGPQGDPIINGGNITQIGQPVGMFYGWIGDGIFRNKAELDKGPIFNPGARDASRVGDVRFKDVSGPDGKPDGVINSFDKVIIGSPYPDFIFGMTNRFSYKNFSLSVSLQGVVGNKVLDLQRGQSANARARFRQYAYMSNYWKSEQQPGDGTVARPNDTPTGNWRGEYSTLWLDNATYLRINNINLGYTLPNRLLAGAGIHSARVYTTLTNPFIFTNYVGFNPDVSRNADPLSPGVSNYDFPTAKSIVFGLNIAF